MSYSQQIAARTAWGEARGEGTSGLQAVLSVIGNRVRQPGWWGRDVPGVCLSPGQFSCWDRNDPNHAKLVSVTAADPQYRHALSLAGLLLSGTLDDNTKGADSYYALGTPRPAWALGERHLRTIGTQAFYRVGVAGLGEVLSTTDALNAAELAHLLGADR